MTALVIAAGAIAPAASVFAADLPAVPMNSDNLSIWDTSTSTTDNPYNTTDVFNIVNDMWGDLFDDGRFNNTTVSDFQRDIVEWSVTKYIEAHPDEEVNGVTVSYFDDIVDYICANPDDFDIYWTPDSLALALAGDPYGYIRFGENFYNNLKDYVLANYYSIPASDVLYINGHKWVASPFTTIYGSYVYGTFSSSRPSSGPAPANVVFYVTRIADGTGYIHCTRETQICYICNGYTSFFPFGSTYLFDGSYYRYLSNGNWYPNSSDTVQYNTGLEALADFYGNFDSASGGGDPVSDGKVYIRDTPIGGDTLTFSYPAYPVSNSKAVSNYYYNTYGDTWEDNTTVIDDTVYNNNLTTLYPVTYDNNIPLWLIQSNSIIETFDYSLELPSAPLETLPADFEGGGSFFQNSFVVLGGFGAFVLIGLSFSLVGLFFKE